MISNNKQYFKGNLDQNLTNLDLVNFQKSLLSWTKFILRDLDHHIKIHDCKSILIGHHLVIFVPQNNHEIIKDEPSFGQSILLAVDIRERSSQQAQIPSSILFFFKSDILNHTYNYKSGELEIWKLGVHSLVRITIKSFEPFTIEYDRIEGPPPLTHVCAAQIYNDCLYAYGMTGPRRMDLYCFDLKKEVWEQRKLKGEDSCLCKSFQNLLN